MKRKNFDRNAKRVLRHKRTFNKIKKIDNEKPRLVINKTNSNISVQLIDVVQQKTIASSSSITLKLKNGNKDNAKKVGTDIATKALSLGVKEVIFDRGGSKYHGRISALANSAREAGLKF